MKITEILIEAPLTDYQTMGDFDKPGPFRGVDKKLVPHPATKFKAIKFFENTPYDFRFFFSNISGTGKHSETGPMSPEQIKTIFGSNADQIINGHENAITVVFVGNSGDAKKMMTPWIMAHRLGHAIQAGNRKNYAAVDPYHPWTLGEAHFFENVNSILEEFYNKVQSASSRRNLRLKSSDIVSEMTPEYNALFNAIGTQRSSRSGEIRRPYEFLYEIFAQYLKTGTVTFNPLPTDLGYGRQAWGNPSKYLTIKSEYRDGNDRKHATEILAYDMELMFNDVMSGLVGQILVM